MLSRAIKPEARLKAAVIDRLYANAHVDSDAVVISEMVVDNWSRRADVVLANGKLWGFEIKSEMDTLGRLPGQMDVFARSFEKLTVVVAARFETQVREMLPDGVGLWVEDRDGILKERVRPRLNMLSREAAIRLMTVSELRRLLSCNGSVGISDAPRTVLEAIARSLPASDLANAARDAVKRRHRGRHQTFAWDRDRVGTAAALKHLARRAPSPQTNEQPPAIVATSVRQHSVPADHPAFVNAPAGPVLRRLRR